MIRTGLRRETMLLRVSTIAIGAVLASMPVTISNDLSGPAWKIALAEKGGKGGGGGNQGSGHGAGNQGNGGQGHAYGRDKSGSDHGRGQGNAEYDDFGAWVGDLSNGKAFGHARRDEHVEKAKERYEGAVSRGRGHGSSVDEVIEDLGREALGRRFPASIG